MGYNSTKPALQTTDVNAANLNYTDHPQFTENVSIEKAFEYLESSLQKAAILAAADVGRSLELIRDMKRRPWQTIKEESAITLLSELTSVPDYRSEIATVVVRKIKITVGRFRAFPKSSRK